MKKRLISLALVLMMSVSVLTGCSLFGIDWESYYNSVVATINYSYTINGQAYNHSEEITKRELLTAYNSYGYNYVDNYGYTKERATETTLDTIIDRKLQIKAVENYYKQNGEDLFSDAEKTYLWEETRESVYTNLIDYYNDIMNIEDGTESEDSTTGTTFTKYEKNATLKYDTSTNLYLVKKVTPVSTLREDGEIKLYEDLVYDFEYKDETGEYIFKNVIYNIIQEYAKDANFRAALNRYMKDVKENYNYMTFKDDKEVMIFEMDRIYQIVKDNYLVERYEIIFNETAKQGSTLTNVRTEAILDYYEKTIKTEYEKYSNDKATFDTDIVNSANSLSYIYEGSDAVNYFNVAVVKLTNFDYKNGYTPADAKTDFDAGKIDEAKYNEELTKIYNSVYTIAKDETTGLPTETKVFARQLLNEIKSEMAKFKYLDLETVLADTENVKLIVSDAGANYSDLTEKEIEDIVSKYVEEKNKQTSYAAADAFIKYFYYYNDDTTFLNKDGNAIFGVSQTGEVAFGSDFESDSSDEFKDAIVKLYNEGKANVGDTTGLIKTESGIYIVFYAGEVKNAFSGINEKFQLASKDILTLSTTRLNIFNDKTIFDNIYDTLFSDTLFDVFRTENLKVLKRTLTTGEETGIVKFPGEYKDMF